MTRLLHDNSWEIRLLLPSKAAGVVIGKGGECVKKLREKYDIRINLPDSSSHERILQLIGQPKSMLAALEVILFSAKECFPGLEADCFSPLYQANRRKVNSKGSRLTEEDNPRSQNNHKGRQPDDSPDSLSETSDEVDVRLLIHQKLAGSVIGRGGTKIRDLREQNHLRVLKLFQAVCPNSTERIVQIAGFVPDCVSCIRSIVTLIQDALNQLRPNPDQPYDPRHSDEALVLQYGGWLSKANFHLLVDQGASALLTALNRTHKSPPASNLENNLAAVNMAAAMARGVFAHGGSGGHFGGANSSSGNPMMMMGMMIPPQHASFNNNNCNNTNNTVNKNKTSGKTHEPNHTSAATKTVQVSVPNIYVGAIMGRGGTRIRSVREESGADIRVNEIDKNAVDRIIEITGTQQEINYAQHLLKSCVLQSQERR